MTQKIRFPNRTKLSTRRAKRLFEFMRTKYIDREDKSHSDIISRVFDKFRAFFSNLGKPVTQNRPLIKNRGRRTDDVNDTFQEIEEDLDVGYQESFALRDATAETFNYFRTRTRSILSKTRRTASKVISLKLQSDKFGSEFIYAGDDFVDRSLIDDNFVLQYPSIDIPVGQNLAVLQRIDNINRAENVVEIEVTTNKPDTQYEGLYYGLAGEARPEGGKFLFEEINTKLLEVDQVYSVTASAESQQYQVGEENVRLRLRKAPKEQLKIQRFRMVDGDPRTFWEIEHSFETSDEFQKFVKQEGGEDGTSGEIVPLYTPDQIFEMVRNDHDKEDFVVEILFKFQSSFVMNWFNLIPHNFDDGNWMEVLNIETSVDGIEYESLDGLFDGKYENTLTSEANAELNKNEVAATLSPSKFQYIGTGLWTFAPRQMQFVRFTIAQKVPHPIPYNVYTYQLKNVGKTTTTVGVKKSGI